jgi:hypothetical protein
VRVAGRLLGEGAAATAESPLRVAIQATHTSAITREQPTLDLGPTWEEIDRLALKYPDDPRMRALHARAVAGQIASARVTRKAPSSERVDELIGLAREKPFGDDALHEQALAASTAAIEVVLDAGKKLPVWSIRRIFGQPSGGHLRLRAFRGMLQARASAAGRNHLRATALFDAALGLATRERAEVESTGYLDWTPPGHLADRIRLEYEGSVVSPQRDDAVLREQLADAFTRLHGIDAERWAAKMLLNRLARGLVPANIVNDVLQHERYDPVRVAACQAHRATPPLLVALAYAIAAAGDADRAVTLLDARLEAATIAGNDKPTIVAVQLAKLAVMHRYRIDPGPFALRLVDGPDRELAAAAIHALSFTSAALINVVRRVEADLAATTSWLGVGSAPGEPASNRELRAVAERDLITVERTALGDAKRGAELLLDVSSAFIEANDAVGALMASIAATLAAARAGARLDELQAALAVATLHYPTVAALLGEGVLPDYEALQTSDIVAGAALIEKAPAGWQEWLFRLIVCLHLARQRREGEGNDQLAAALEASYGSRLPEELVFGPRPAPPPSAPHASSTGSFAPIKVPQTNRLQSWVINGAVVLVSLGAIAGIFLAADGTERLLDRHFQGSPVVPIVIGAAAFLVWLLVGLTSKDNRWLAVSVIRSVFFDFPRALLVTREAAILVTPPAAKSAELTLSIARHTRFRALPRSERAVESWDAELPFPAPGKAYADVSKALPEHLVTGINDLERGFVVHRLVPIVAQRGESVLPWEAYLRLALSPARVGSELWLYRAVAGARRARRERREPSTGGVGLIHDVQDSWAMAPWSASRVEESERAAIGHAIGIPLRSSSGTRLDVGSRHASEAPLWARYPAAKLLILQLSIVDSPVRAGTDRQQVADLRELGFDAALSGTPFVLVLPAMEKDDAILLITTLAARLAGKEPTLDHLLSITEHLRTLLLRPKDPHAAELAEQAFDITLFAAETAPLQGGKTAK